MDEAGLVAGAGALCALGLAVFLPAMRPAWLTAAILLGLVPLAQFAGLTGPQTDLVRPVCVLTLCLIAGSMLLRLARGRRK